VSSTTATGLGVAQLRGDVGDQHTVLGDQIGLPRHHIKGDVRIGPDLIVAAQRLDALLVSVCTLECAVDDGPLAHVSVPVFPAQDDVQHEVQAPEAFVTLGLAPHIN
jgi:hypothetical protein